MALITLACAGTLGDHYPYIALGLGLARRGHRVRMACRSAMHGLARAAGLEVFPCGPDWDDAHARQRAKEWDEWSASSSTESPAGAVDQAIAATRGKLQHELPSTYSDLARACEGADLLVAGLQRQMYAALLERNGGPRWVAASVTPAHQCAAQGQHRLRLDPRTIQPFVPTLEAFCQTQGLVSIDWTGYDRALPRALLGGSAHFAPVLPEYAHYVATGFWFHPDPQETAPAPDPALQAFVSRHPRPLFLSFSSIPVVDAAAMLNLHARAAQRLGRGLVVQRGAAAFDATMLAPDIDPQGVHFVGFLSPDWLLSHADAILHHGGAGTLARALLNACPMLVQPLGNDQFFNAQRVIALGIGAAAHPRNISPDALARLLEQKVLTAATQARAAALGDLLRSENGVGRACDLLQQWLP
jgi:UDP:flavonoid glycosyltransferase YjiC (YdhE family)